MKPACLALLGSSLVPPSQASPAPRDARIQGLRAWAALLVLPAHVFLAESSPLAAWLSHLGAGRAGVLLFFVISGYVIGIAPPRP